MSNHCWFSSVAPLVKLPLLGRAFRKLTPAADAAHVDKMLVFSSSALDHIHRVSGGFLRLA